MPLFGTTNCTHLPTYKTTYQPTCILAMHNLRTNQPLPTCLLAYPPAKCHANTLHPAPYKPYHGRAYAFCSCSRCDAFLLEKEREERSKSECGEGRESQALHLKCIQCTCMPTSQGLSSMNETEKRQGRMRERIQSRSH